MLQDPVLLRPVEHETRALFVGNAGAPVGLPPERIAQLCTIQGVAPRVDVPNANKTFLYVIFETESLASQARQVLMDAAVVGRQLTVKYADLHPKSGMNATEMPHVFQTSEEAGIPGLYLYHDFLTETEEREILERLENEEWRDLAKRQVCHFGYAFEYLTRSVSTEGCNGPIPSFVEAVQKRIEALPDIDKLDQLTVNKYPAGVGLSPHVDAHSAFTGAITSLSLGSGAVMEFRRADVRKPVLLPRRSLAVMAHECRYGWYDPELCREHYIPHRKTDTIDGEVVYREPFRVSLTFRQARGYPCTCDFPDMCDSQNSPLPPTRLLQLHQHLSDLEPELGSCSKHSSVAENTATASVSACIEHDTSCSAAARQHDGLRCVPAAHAVCESTHSYDFTSCGGAAPEPAAQTVRCTAARDAGGDQNDCCQDTETVTHRGGSLDERSDSQQGRQGRHEGDQKRLRQLEVEHVHRVYEAIAPHFSATRFAIWPAVRAFIESLPAGAVVADVGCGNGKYLGVRQDIAVLASDRSAGLVNVALQRVLQSSPGQPKMPAADAFIADGMALPYRHCSCDAVLCIAVLHHISSPERRCLFLKRLRDILIIGGRALVTVWATEQEKPSSTVAKWTPLDVGTPMDEAAEQSACTSEAQNSEQENAADYFVPWHLPFHRAGAHLAAANATGGCTKDTDDSVDSEPAQASIPEAAVGVIDNKKKTVMFKRYYHLFADGELKDLAESVEGVVVRKSFYDASNWVIDFERVS